MRRKCRFFGTALLLVFSIFLQAFASPAKAAERKESGEGKPEEYDRLKQMDVMLENEYLEFYIDKTNAIMGILDKKSGAIWFSNPLPDEQSDDTIAPLVKGRLLSQISLVYLTKAGKPMDYNSYDDSVLKQQFEIAKSENCVEVTYYFGSQDKSMDEVLPKQISAKRFQELLLNQLKDKEDQKQISSRYKFDEKKKKYTRREIPQSAEKRVIELFEKAGYTEEDLASDNAENGIQDTGEATKPGFQVVLEYHLEKENLLVKVDTKKIKENLPYRINLIRVLEDFGAAGPEEQGYTFIPDGSGSLIYHNNGKTSAQGVNLPIYGMDEMLETDEKIGNTEASRMPVFGIKNNDSALFAVIESGDAIGEVCADIGGKLQPYNTVGSQFTVLPKDEVKLSARETIIKTPKETYSGDITIRYAFLNGEEANYSGMANYYRNYLKAKYSLEELEDADIPLFLELTGMITKKDSFLGISYDKKMALTNLVQARTITEKLRDRGIDNINVVYTGWFNGGIKHKIPTKVKSERELGSRRDWKLFLDEMKKEDIHIYPDVSLLRIYKDSHDFKPSRHAAQRLSRKIAKVYEFNPATYLKEHDEFSHFILSPNAVDSVWDKFLKGYGKYGLGAVSLRDVGMDLSSDFRRKSPVTRQDAEKKIVDKIADIHQEIPDTLMHGGNVYVLPYTKSILEIPQESNQFAIADESVPFYEMVLHGYLDYAGRPFNLSTDIFLQTLRHFLGNLIHCSDLLF